MILFYLRCNLKNAVQTSHHLYSTTQTQDIITNLASRRLTDLNQELSRLALNPRIKQSFNQICTYHRYGVTAKDLVQIGRSLELREHLKDDYYIINHGQNNNSIIVNIVAKKSLEIFEAKKPSINQVLRHPVFLKDSSKDISWFKENLHMGNQDLNYSNELLSGDIILEHVTPSESAIDFFTGTANMLNGPRMLRGADGQIKIVHEKNYQDGIITKIMLHYFTDKDKALTLSNKIAHLGKSIQDGGTLYSICVPKESFCSIGYLAKAFGKAVKDPTEEELDSLQNGVFTPPEGPLLQARLLNKKLNLEEGVLIIPHSSLSNERVKKVEDGVEDCLLQASKAS